MISSKQSHCTACPEHNQHGDGAHRKRHQLVRTLARVLSCMFALLLLLTPAHAEVRRLPNVVLIVADDLGYGEVGCFGQKWIKTPHIDQLARDGVRFTNFYSGNAVCAPSRCCLMTGKHPGRAYIRGNGDPKDLQYLASQYGWKFPGQNPIPDAEVTVAELLKQQGYATAAIGKWGLGHFGTSGDPNHQGFDLFYGFNCQRHAHNHYPKFLWRNRDKEAFPGNDRTLTGDVYSQDRFTEVAVDFIQTNADKPFFLYLPFAIPHLSIQVPEKSLEEYGGKIPEESYQHRGYLKHPHPRAGYAAMVSHMDRDIGRILDTLDKYQLAEDTLVIFTSDNGPTFDRLGGSDSDFFDSSAGLRGRKGSLYEGGIRVPMVARWKGKIAPKSTSDHIAAFWDVLPTLCEAVRIETPSAATGTSFLNALQGQENSKSDYLYWEFPSYGGQQAIRDGRYKAIRQGLSKAKDLAEVKTELYDLEADPTESQDIAAQHPEIVERLTQLMSDAREPSVCFPFPVLDKASQTSVRPGINENFVAQDLEVPEWEERFEVESREVYASREAIVAAMELSPGDSIADIGAGTGLFTFLFSDAVGNDGHVAAVDISNSFLRHIDAKAKQLNRDNVTTVRGRAATTLLAADSLDAAFICDTYHHFELPDAMLASLHNAIRKGGQLVIVDFDRIPGTSREWILNHVRAGRETVQQEIEQAGFRLIAQPKISGLKENYVLRFERR